MKSKKVLFFYQKIYLKLLEKKKNWKEEQRFPGGLRHPDKQFYIIRRSGMKLGLFSFFNTHLARIDYAVKNGIDKERLGLCSTIKVEPRIHLRP